MKCQPQGANPWPVAGGPLIGPKVGTHALRDLARSSQFHRDERVFAPVAPNLRWIGHGPQVEVHSEDESS
jgi:hypothetical protein